VPSCSNDRAKRRHPCPLMAMQMVAGKLLWRPGCSADADEIGKQIALTPALLTWPTR